MRKTMMTCDRCGKEAEIIGSKLYPRGWSFTEISRGHISDGVIDDVYETCRECMDDLASQMKFHKRPKEQRGIEVLP